MIGLVCIGLFKMNETDAFTINQLRGSAGVGMKELMPSKPSAAKIKEIQANNRRNKKYAFAFVGLFGGDNLTS